MVKQTAAWPAYLVAAACFAIALVSSIADMSLRDQLKTQQHDVATVSARSIALARSLVEERTALLDIVSGGARHYPIGNGEMIVRGSRGYLALRAIPDAPRGRVYEVWTRARGSTRVLPSQTFLPDARGAAFIELSSDARSTVDVFLTLEPEGGSQQPTGKPLMDAALGPP